MFHNSNPKSDSKQEKEKGMLKRKSSRKTNKSYAKYIAKVINFSIDDDNDLSAEKSIKKVKINPEIDLTVIDNYKF